MFCDKSCCECPPSKVLGLCIGLGLFSTSAGSQIFLVFQTNIDSILLKICLSLPMYYCRILLAWLAPLICVLVGIILLCFDSKVLLALGSDVWGLWLINNSYGDRMWLSNGLRWYIHKVVQEISGFQILFYERLTCSNSSFC